ncbi:MAG TPA: DUF4038 domain-containing protein [Bryobacteraceae bacterium]|jgi:hypothetical protein|nr:DUF4038 domain-containing protein [Bryobacteraceae bacterium]
MSAELSRGPLRISDNGRFLVHADGAPFFWLGDTAWELIHRLKREEIDFYLENRAAKRFTVIQAVLLAEFGGLEIPNAYGRWPLIDFDPRRIDEGYFQLVDWTVARAAEKGLYLGLLPTWGNKVVAAPWEKAPPRIIFNEENARAYGFLLGERYRQAQNIVWILGGDRSPCGVEAIWRAMAQGLRAGDRGAHLITFHPPGVGSSSQLHNEPWLDFNMIQSGHHSRDFPNYLNVGRDYGLKPSKPVLDGEPRYEDHPVDWKPDEKGYFDDYDVRQAAYWALLAGACGHTYGCHAVWQMLTHQREAIGFAHGDWRSALDLPGAEQMRYVRELFSNLDFLSLRPADSLVVDNSQDGWQHAGVAGAEGIIVAYLPGGGTIRLRKSGLPEIASSRWFDPRTGAMREAHPENRELLWQAPGPYARGNDWVLVLELERR